jgi:hypothetical protein
MEKVIKIPSKYIRVYEHIIDVDGCSIQYLIDAATSAGCKPHEFEYMTVSCHDDNNTISLSFDKEVENLNYETEMIAYNKYQAALLQEQLLRKLKHDRCEVNKRAKFEMKTNSRKDRLLNSISALRKSGKDPLLQQFLEAKLKSML